MGRSSMFKRITTYRDSEALKPSENKVTEAFAVLLEEVDGLGFYLVGEWLGEPDLEIEASLTTGDDSTTGLVATLPDTDTTRARSLGAEYKVSPVKVATQVTVWSRKEDRHGFVDLELRFSATGSRDRVVRVEVKHGSPLHGEQLSLYLEDEGLVTVVLLAPFRQFRDLNNMRPDVVAKVEKRSWQRTAERIAAFPRESDAEVGEVDQWLIKQFIRFLREEKLMSPEAVGPQHLVAMANHKEALEALKELNERARQQIETKWTRHEEVGQDPGDTKKGYAAYSRYPLEEGAKSQELGPVWFEFKASAEDVFESAEELHFIAGASWDLKTDAPSMEGWEALRNEPFFFRDFPEGGCGRFMRVATPSSVLSGAKLDDQGKELGEWALKTFEALAEVMKSSKKA
jgi:hypothetical protein